MPVTMSGMASGMDTDAIIQKLVEIEARPIKQYEIDKQRYKDRRAALQILEKKLKTLNDRAKGLYGYEAAYDDKRAISSNTGVLEASATRLADLGTRNIEVLQTASTHKISSDQLSEDKKLPGGRFTISVDGISHNIRFKGGTLKTLRERIDEDASEMVSTSFVRTDGTHYVMTIQSKVPGKKGEIQIKGSESLLKKAGLVSGPKDGEKSSQDLIFDQRYFTSYMGKEKLEKETGSLSVGADGKGIKVNGLLWREYALPLVASVSKETKLEFDFKYFKEKEDEARGLPFKVELGPEEKTLIKGIELRGYNISRIRPLEKKPEKKKYDSLLGIGVVYEENGQRVEKLYNIDETSKGKQEIPIGRDFAGKKISRIVFYCNRGTAEYLNARISTPLDDKDLLKPKNVIADAKDAKIKLDGVEIVRDRNNDINDVIKGVSLTLKQPSKVPVSLKIEPDIEKALDKIREFVEAYNDYIIFHKELIKAEPVNKPGERKKNSNKNGLFVGDMSLIRIENMVKRTVNGAYPSRADVPVKLITQIGVSTGKINSTWESIKEGKLVIDEAVLKKIIRDNPEGVRMFFASDSDGDNRPDSGMAFILTSNLQPYISYGKNIIKSKIDLEDDSIRIANERIERQEEHVKKYEEKLRMKFAAMEKALSGAKAQKKWLNSQMGGGGNKEKD